MSSSDEIDSGLSYNGLDNLFDSLKASLELGKSLNYQNDISSSEKCIGEFLSHTSESIKDIKNAVKNHYKHKKKLETTSRNLSYKKPNILPQKKYFEVIIENLLEKGKIESIFANKIAKNKGDVMLDHLKTWILGAIAQIEKEKKLVRSIIAKGHKEISYKKIALKEDYMWNQFVLILESAFLKCWNVREIDSFPSQEIIKEIGENLKYHVKFKRGVTIETNLTSVKSKNTIKIYESHKEIPDLFDVLASFQEPKIIERNHYREDTYISRNCDF